MTILGDDQTLWDISSNLKIVGEYFTLIQNNYFGLIETYAKDQL